MEAGNIELDNFIPINVWIEAWSLYTHGESWWLDDEVDFDTIQERDTINNSATDNGVAQNLYIELIELVPEVKGNVSKGRISATKIIRYLSGSNHVNNFDRSQMISLVRQDNKYNITNNGLIEVGEEGVKQLEQYNSSNYF